MRKGDNIGEATVVDQTGKAMPDKYQSYMRSMIRSTAESHGKDTLITQQDTIFRWHRDPLIAEAMVDDRVVVPNLVDSGKVLTFTAQEAVKWHYCEGLAESVDLGGRRIIKKKNYDLVAYQPSFYDRVNGFLLSPML